MKCVQSFRLIPDLLLCLSAAVAGPGPVVRAFLSPCSRQPPTSSLRVSSTHIHSLLLPSLSSILLLLSNKKTSNPLFFFSTHSFLQSCCCPFGLHLHFPSLGPAFVILWFENKEHYLSILQPICSPSFFRLSRASIRKSIFNLLRFRAASHVYRLALSSCFEYACLNHNSRLIFLRITVLLLEYSRDPYSHHSLTSCFEKSTYIAAEFNLVPAFYLDTWSYCGFSVHPLTILISRSTDNSPRPISFR